MNAGGAEQRDGVAVASSKITPRHLERLAIRCTLLLLRVEQGNREAHERAGRSTSAVLG